MRGGRTATAARASSANLLAGRRRVGSLVGYEHITETPHRLNITRRRWIRFDELAQPRHLHVDGAIEHIVVASAGKEHQFFTSQRLPGVAREHLEQTELAGRQCNCLTAAPQLSR